MRVRYFAAAAEAAGTDSEPISAGTVGELRRQIVDRHGARMASVLPRCAVLVDGVRADDATLTLAESVVVDVLPPFAGG